MSGSPTVTATQSPILGPYRPQVVRYTGFTSNATFGSRTAITAPLVVGAVLCMDEVGNSDGTAGSQLGLDYTRPQTSLLGARKVVVVDVPESSRLGGFVTVVPYSESVLALVQGNFTRGNSVAVVDGQFFLAPTATITITSGNIDQTAQNLLDARCGRALFTENVGAAALRRVTFTGGATN